MPRSHELITLDDLRRLGEIAAEDREDFFQRYPNWGSLYSNRLFAVALCQAGAVHYLNGINGRSQEPPGIKDLDVWSFFRVHPERPFPSRRFKKVDFGDPKFGISDDSPQFVGRRVDLLSRSMSGTDFSNPVEVLRKYLREGGTDTAKALAQKAVILIEPFHLLGTKVWPE
jgi:hypothetical protein